MSYTEDPDTIKSDDEERPEQADLDADGTPDDEDDEGVDKSKWPDIHKDALLEYERAWERERMNIDEAYDDLRFRRGRVSDQWDACGADGSGWPADARQQQDSEVHSSGDGRSAADAALGRGCPG
jgi:hypothetical protein